MAKQPTPIAKQTEASAAGEDLQSIPSANVDAIHAALGLDIARQTPDSLRAILRTSGLSRSMSASPYTSADMLAEYRDKGFPELVDKVIATIDAQIAHRQALEVLEAKRTENREDRAQIGAQVIGGAGLVVCLSAAYLGVSPWLCGVGIVVSIGGPNAATILARVMDKLGK